MTQLNGSRGTDIDCALIHFIYVSAANNMRDDGKNNLVFAIIGGSLSEQKLENRNLSPSRNAAGRFRPVVFQNSPPKVHFPTFLPKPTLHPPLPTNGWGNTPQVPPAR